MKKFLFAICSVVALTGAVSVHAAPEFKYVFEPSATQNPIQDPYLNSQWGGTLFLDAPMSAGGGLGDIFTNVSSLKTPFGSFDLSQGIDVAIGTISRTSTTPVPFTWTSSTITSMDIAGFGPLVDGTGALDVWQITSTFISIGLNDPTVNGVWVAGVPDSASTAVLIGLAAAGLCGFSYCNRSRQLAMARR
jgi:hypothetical protein